MFSGFWTSMESRVRLGGKDGCSCVFKSHQNLGLNLGPCVWKADMLPTIPTMSIHDWWFIIDIFIQMQRHLEICFNLSLILKIKWLGNLTAFFVLFLCSLFPCCYMTLTLHRLQKVLRCKWANGQLSNEPSHLEQKIITVTLHTTWNKAARL